MNLDAKRENFFQKHPTFFPIEKMLLVHEIFFSCFTFKLIDVKNCQSIDNIDIVIKGKKPKYFQFFEIFIF